MRIKKVRIRNFRSIIDTEEISLNEKITLLLGKNEQGKTNFLKALESFGKGHKYEDDDLSYLIDRGSDTLSNPIATIWFKLDDDDRKKLSAIDKEFEKLKEMVVAKYFDGRYEIEKPDMSKFKSRIFDIKHSILNLLNDHEKAIKDSLDLLNKIDKNKHINWLKSLQRPDGGFWEGTGTNQSQITHTYFAVKALEELGALNPIEGNKLIRFITSCQNPNGGFSYLPNQLPQAQPTYYAIMLLKGMKGYLTEEHKRNVQQLVKAVEIEEIIRMLYNILNNILSVQISDKNVIELREYMKNKVEELNEIAEDNLQTAIMNFVPKLLYFNSVDIIKDTISINNYLENREKYKTFTKLFQLAGLNIDKLKNTTRPHPRKQLFRNATVRITGKINKFWTQEHVDVNLDIDGDQILVFIEDNMGAQADPPSRRSDGFRWFLSFYINFMAGTEAELRNSILLLDNLAWALHPSGQRDLLKALEEIAKANQIIFATHSPFLIDKNKLERIRIVERRERVGTKVYEKFWDSMFDSLQVIRASIGADISDSLFGHKNNIVVEGFSDKIYLESMNGYQGIPKETISTDKMMIVGAGGADKVPYLVAWFNAEKYNSLALLDSDKEGRKAAQRMKKNGNVQADKILDILMLDEISEEFKGKDVEIEDLFDEDFYNRAVNLAYKEVFENKLGKPEIHLDEIPSDGLRAKRYSRFFKDKGLGSFDKVKVALEIKKILSGEKSKETEDISEETMNNFRKLFTKIKEKFKGKGVEL